MAGMRAGGGGGGGKLSLKRRRREDRGGGGRGTFSTKASWFENQDLSDAETSWVTLLRAVDPLLSCSSLEKFVNFPEFLPKSSQNTTPQPHLETFNSGTKTFEWAPFPVYGDYKTADSGRRQNSVPEKCSSGRENEVFQAIPLVPEQTSQTAKECTAEDANSSIRHTIDLEDEAGFEMC